MMFESRGVWDARSTYTRKDRINKDRLNDFRRGLEARSSNQIKRLVASDQLFRTSARTAYADAWTLTFFLSETRPMQYSNYLARVAARKAFSKYSARARVADFAKAFGSDLEMLDVQLQRFVEEMGKK